MKRVNELKAEYWKELDNIKKLWEIEDDFQCLKIFCQAHYLMRGYRPEEINKWTHSFDTLTDLQYIFEKIMDELRIPSNIMMMCVPTEHYNELWDAAYELKHKYDAKNTDTVL